MKINEVMEIAKWFNDSQLSSFTWEENDSKLKLEKEEKVIYAAEQVLEKRDSQAVTAPKVNPMKPEKESGALKNENGKEEDGLYVIKSPVVGTFYSAPSPEEKPFVTVGQRVSKGDVVCIVEAMKLLNEITSPVDGVVKELLVENEALLEFEQKIMKIEV